MKNLSTFKWRFTTSLVASAISASLAMSSTQVFAHDKESLSSLSVAKQSEQEARLEDLSILAKETNMTFEEAEAAMAFQERFSLYAEKLMKRMPDKISRIWLEKAPAMGAHIEFVGAMPRIRPEENVFFSDGGMYSIQENIQRAELVAKMLKDAGHRNFLTQYNAETGLIDIEFAMKNKALAPSKTQLLTTLRSAVEKDSDYAPLLNSIQFNDLSLTVVEKEGEIYDLDHSRGGNWLRDDGFRECTSGWAVNGPSGDGIITAAHCVGLNQFEESPTSIYSMTWRDQERGVGDVEYHTTTHIEPAEFWATSSSLRDVNSIKLTWLMFPGSTVCVYGRSSNIRSCAHNIIATGVTATFTDGVTVSSLVRASGDTSIGGDSGGGWSYNFTAWGVHSGSNGTTSLFTPIQTAQSQLNVTVKLQP